MKTLIQVLGFISIITPVVPVFAQDYPNRVITMIVPFPAGGPTDVVGRLVAQVMSSDLQQQVVVENVGGAAGAVGSARVARAAPDGYTLLLHNSSHSIAPALNANLPYDPVSGFEPIGLINDVPQAVVGKKDLPPKDFKELLAYLKQRGAKINMANAGRGSASHMCGLLFMSAIKTPLTPVAYRGTGPAVNDLMGGQVDLMCDQVSNTGPQIAAGTIKAYCVATKDKVASLPAVPTCNDAGLTGFEASVWHGVYAPKGTPKPIVDKLSTALQAALRDDKVKQRFVELGMEPMPQERATSDGLRAHLKAEIEKWGPILKEAGVQPE